MSRVIFHEYGTELRQEGDDSLVLNVLCGRVAEFGVEFALNESEREGYRQGGDGFLKELAANVRQDPTVFASRGKYC